MAGCEGVERIIPPKATAHCSLALKHFQASDRQAKCGSQWIDDVLERIAV